MSTREKIKGTLLLKTTPRQVGAKFVKAKDGGQYLKKFYAQVIWIKTEKDIIESMHWGRSFDRVHEGDIVSFTANVRNVNSKLRNFKNPRAVNVHSRIYDELYKVKDPILRNRLEITLQEPLRTHKFDADKPVLALREISNEKD